jgi:NAD-dependent dihydropyrimidine dehydrogenase PreA subunit
LPPLGLAAACAPPGHILDFLPHCRPPRAKRALADGGSMPFVIAEPCIGVKDKSCVEVCPVNCIYEGEDQYYIHPDECIDCQACEAACPVQAIFPDNGVPDKWKSYIEKNRVYFENK